MKMSLRVIVVSWWTTCGGCQDIMVVLDEVVSVRLIMRGLWLPDVRHLLRVQLLPFQINWQSLKVSSFFLILSTRSATSTPVEYP